MTRGSSGAYRLRPRPAGDAATPTTVVEGRVTARTDAMIANIVSDPPRVIERD